MVKEEIKHTHTHTQTQIHTRSTYTNTLTDTHRQREAHADQREKINRKRKIESDVTLGGQEKAHLKKSKKLIYFSVEFLSATSVCVRARVCIFV